MDKAAKEDGKVAGAPRWPAWAQGQMITAAAIASHAPRFLVDPLFRAPAVTRNLFPSGSPSFHRRLSVPVSHRLKLTGWHGSAVVQALRNRTLESPFSARSASGADLFGCPAQDAGCHAPETAEAANICQMLPCAGRGRQKLARQALVSFAAWDPFQRAVISAKREPTPQGLGNAMSKNRISRLRGDDGPEIPNNIGHDAAGFRRVAKP